MFPALTSDATATVNSTGRVSGPASHTSESSRIARQIGDERLERQQPAPPDQELEGGGVEVCVLVQGLGGRWVQVVRVRRPVRMDVDRRATARRQQEPVVGARDDAQPGEEEPDERPAAHEDVEGALSAAAGPSRAAAARRARPSSATPSSAVQ